MAKRTKSRHKKPRGADLLTGYLEGISWRVFEYYPAVLKRLIHRKGGVYALYKGPKLFYVGLASNLMWRLKAHLKDRLASKWDRFSVYLAREDQHIKQLETLLLRISKPPGNRVKGKFQQSANLYRELNSAMSAADADQRATMIGGHVERNRRRRKMRDEKGIAALSGLVDRRIPLRARNNGKLYRATLRRDGVIAYQGKRYLSPSAAGIAALGRGVNGWSFWRFRNAAGEWVRLREMRT